MRLKTKVEIILAMTYVGIFALIDAVWQILEVSIYESTQPSLVDTVIGALFALSLCLNLIHGMHICIIEKGDR